MALITNRGKLINDLPLSNEINDNDLLIIQRPVDNGNRTERINFGTIKTYVLSQADESIENYDLPSSFTNSGNKFTGSFYSPDGKIANLYKLKIRDTLEFSGDLTLVNLTVNGTINNAAGGIVTTNLVANNAIGGSTLSIAGAASIGGTLTSDTINNVFDITTDTVTSTTVTTNLLNASYINVSNILSANSIGGNSISGSHSGSLLSKNVKATGSFYGNFNGNAVKVSNIIADGLQINGPTITATGATITANQFIELGDGFSGNLNGNVFDPGSGIMCLSTDGFTPGTVSKVSKLFGTSSYSLKSLYAENVSGTPVQAKTSSYVTYTGNNNGTVYNSINSVTSYQSAILRGMHILSQSILLTSSYSPWLGTKWQQLPSANRKSDGTLTGSAELLSSPDNGIRYIMLNKPLTYIRNAFTNYSASYILIRAELIGKAGPPNGTTSNFVIDDPHFAKLQIVSNYPGFDDLIPNVLITQNVKQLIIPFQRNNSISSCCSEQSTFLLPLPSDVNQTLFYAPIISSSAGKEIDSKANAQFSWSYNIYLDGVL